MFEIFETEHANSELKRVEKHMERVKVERKRKHDKKLPNDESEDILDENGNQPDDVETALSNVKVKRRRNYLFFTHFYRSQVFGTGIRWLVRLMSHC